MPNIAQQDYIIIDWEGKTDSDATKKAEVDSILSTMYKANPLSLLSVVFVNYTSEGNVYPIVSISNPDDVSVCLAFIDEQPATVQYVVEL